MKKYVLIMVIIITGLMAIVPSGHVDSGIHATPELSAGNNTLVPGDAVYIMGYYAPYNLYVTAPTNISSPMITPFVLNVTAAGSARATLSINGAVVANESFSNNLLIYDNTTYTGYHNLTLLISSANGREAFHWTLNFMSPVTYLSYQNQKAKALQPGISVPTVAGIVVSMIIITAALYRIFLPAHRDHVRQKWIKEGPRRHV